MLTSKTCGLRPSRIAQNGVVSLKACAWTPYIADYSGISQDLGRTATLVDYSDSERTPTIWLSYWKDLKGLQEFSTSAAHRLGMNKYNAKKYPYMGIMHETFFAPKGCWETIYDDFPLWGLG